MVRSEQSVARTDSVRLKLSPDMVGRLERLAEAYGMPLSTLGAFALAEWVVGKENNVRLARDAVMGVGAALGEQAQRVLGELADSAHFEQMVVQVGSHVASRAVTGDALPTVRSGGACGV